MKVLSKPKTWEARQVTCQGSKEALGLLKEIVAIAMSAIPSGQVAEDEAVVRKALRHDDGCLIRGESDECTCKAADAIAALAAQAQSAATLGAQLDGANERARLLLDAKNHWADRARAAEKRCAALSAAGQVLSDHVDKAPEWTMRDEFAKAAMQAIIIACRSELDQGMLKYSDVVRRAYGLADAMMTAREET